MNGRNRISVSHLQFAYDLSCEAKDPYISNIRVLVTCFEKITGLRVNLERSNFSGLNIVEGELDSYTPNVGMRKGRMAPQVPWFATMRKPLFY